MSNKKNKGLSQQVVEKEEAQTKAPAAEQKVGDLASAKDIEVGKPVNTKDSRPSREGAVREFILKNPKCSFAQIVEHLKSLGYDPSTWKTNLKQSFGLLKRNLKNKGLDLNSEKKEVNGVTDTYYWITKDPNFKPKEKPAKTTEAPATA